MVKQIDRRQRIRPFVTLFLGIIYDFWREARLARKIGLKAARERMSPRHRRRAVKFRETSVKLGGVLIKLGQFFSTRVDVMPPEYIEELAKLQDTVPPVDFAEIKQLIEAEFKKPLAEVFPQFTKEAWAAASLAQVHMATLPNGQEVAVKVQRPDIDRLADIDLATFSYLMEGLDRFTRVGQQVDIGLIVAEFAKTLGDELDFMREAANAERFKSNFADDKLIYVPKVYWEYTTTKVLTLERVHAIKINDYQALEKAGINRKAVARCVVESYLKQVLEDGFFHADPHPGNLFVTQGAEGPVVTYVDFGMVGEVTPPMKQAFREAMIAIGQRDVDKLVDALRVLGFLRPGANVQAVKKAIQWLFDNYRAVSAQTLNFKQIEELHEDILQILRDQPLMVPAQFAFLGKTVGSMIGLATGLDPEFDIIEVTKPYVQKMISQATKDWPNLILNEVKSWAQMATQVPRQLSQVLELASKEQLTVNLKTEARATAQRQEAKLWPVTIFSLLLAGGGFYLLVNQGLKTEGLLLLFLGIGTFWYNLR